MKKTTGPKLTKAQKFIIRAFKEAPSNSTADKLLDVREAFYRKFGKAAHMAPEYKRAFNDLRMTL